MPPGLPLFRRRCCVVPLLKTEGEIGERSGRRGGRDQGVVRWRVTVGGAKGIVQADRLPCLLEFIVADFNWR